MMRFTIDTICFFLSATVLSTEGFTFQNPTRALLPLTHLRTTNQGTIVGVGKAYSSCTTTILWMNTDNSSNENVEEESGEEEEGKEEDAVVEEEDKGKEEEEDQELKAIKEEIASLEASLRNKRMDCSRLEDMAEEYTESGYLRKCAEMDNTRKRSVSSHQTSKYAARANVVKQHFLTILEQMQSLHDQYPTGNSYNALLTDLDLVLQKKIEVTPYEAVPGKDITANREAVVGYELSDTIPKGAILRTVHAGLEIHGNVIRPAQCIVSKGATEEEEKEEEDTVKEDAKESKGFSKKNK